MASRFRITVDDLSSAATRELLALHLAGMGANSPAQSVFALDLSGLRTPDIVVLSAWSGDRIATVGALRDLGNGAGEIKSMRTHPDFVRRGAASALLDALIERGRAAGLSRFSLETGSGPAFEPALALYRQRGFAPGPAFGTYTASAFNRFYHLDL